MLWCDREEGGWCVGVRKAVKPFRSHKVLGQSKPLPAKQPLATGGVSDGGIVPGACVCAFMCVRAMRGPVSRSGRSVGGTSLQRSPVEIAAEQKSRVFVHVLASDLDTRRDTAWSDY